MNLDSVTVYDGRAPLDHFRGIDHRGGAGQGMLNVRCANEGRDLIARNRGEAEDGNTRNVAKKITRRSMGPTKTLAPSPHLRLRSPCHPEILLKLCAVR
jgi:hypothetical protein